MLEREASAICVVNALTYIRLCLYYDNFYEKNCFIKNIFSWGWFDIYKYLVKNLKLWLKLRLNKK
jgi:hypothetical protein